MTRFSVDLLAFIMAEIDRDLGRHDAEISQLKDDMRALKEDVHEIKLMLSEAKGGWRVIMLIAGVAGTIGAMLSQLLPQWFHK